MSKHGLAWLMGLVLLPVGVLHASACQFRGQVDIAGVSEVIDDCIQRTGASEAQHRQFCEQHVAAVREMSSSFGGQVQGEMHWLGQCPTGAQGRCEGYGGMQMDTYYYSRAPEMLEGLPQSCSMLGGRWVSGD